MSESEVQEKYLNIYIEQTDKLDRGRVNVQQITDKNSQSTMEMM